MNHFHRLTPGVNVSAALLELESHPDLWDQNRLRTTHAHTSHGQVSDIWMRFNAIPDDPTTVIDDRECVDYPAMSKLREMRKLVMNIFAYVGGYHLGRVLVTKLPPSGKITPHRDMGAPAEYYNRFHLCLQACAAVFRCEDEAVGMLPGELWFVNNSVEHEVLNGPTIDRIHLIVDVQGGDWVETVYGFTGQASSKPATLEDSDSAASPSSA